MWRCNSAYLIVLYTLVDTSHGFSYRRGSHASEQGYSDVQIRACGRWKSDAFKVYLSSEVLYAK